MSSIENQFTHPDNAAIVDEKLLKNHSDLVIPSRVIAPQNSNNVLTSAFL